MEVVADLRRGGNGGVKVEADEFPCLGVCCCLAEIIAINLDTSSNNNNTSEDIDYDSPEYRGPPKTLLKWYGYLSDEYKDKGDNENDAKPSFLDISMAKACMLAKAQASDASSKAKVQACGSKTKLQTSMSKTKLQRSPKTLIVKSPVPITNGVLRITNAETCDANLSKTFGVKIPPTMACA
uniref:Uncharacterized protein n=1 Tax=Tanacetum cinerariifolium TaxID=118510 RepID=A0A6L2KVL9_TANCI|nr:hypothetical protein [Tanacetum cinerariifolium]